MIGWLHGQIVDRHQPGKLVLDVNGVGYDVETSLNTFFQIENDNQPVGLHIHTIVREDALLLYGFLDKEERSLFRALIKVNGIGPKLAMAILSSISPKEFIQCIHQENAALLTKLPGIGKKTAERLVIEMRDSIKQFDGTISDTLQKQAGSAHSQEEAISALEALGYKPQEAWKAVNKIDNGNKSCEQLIREALQILSSR
ncbi:Holliday junction branch migration protein RuvA [Legionella pneumophila]|uniref:Holliday junction branch migration complex subunit RuvA n=1 Tax=Legionella pneumophila subsp. pascullei TaxID=91890 RepID=A0AAX2IWB2_LEGPN|nr:Holliday junction branch migration protein RuvA [Legionella pneumophila]AMP90048.1 Holliday junction branch migration protein RuvA [Legionella pneumophila subsp. pascullei]AMP92285.1 Holliday junction ATP-dependent DNA helicase RuvA [Legionella pneumophila subsp. pascullei]AMP95250.1 Holliday junction ATP-dependent DNA helicase RuvA [Legionella pneumophila subsp. pascullei]SQG90142.1 Holliday junction ATP-dependent DNA helicase RuvA [Legionella pneumophila subsp. pascullei]VEH06118.1 Hollid